MKSISFTITTILLSFILLNSCKKEKQDALRTELKLPQTDFTYDQDNAKAKLGRVLFYDKALSANNSISCGSCHKQSLAFSDGEVVSSGFDGRVGNRNTPAIQNITPHFQELFWDGRESHLSIMVTKPIFNHVEMGIRSNEYLLNSVKAKPYYKELFKEAFSDEEISFENIGDALTNFIASLNATNSEFDRPTEERSFEVNEGEKLFFGKYNCGNCHNVRNPKGYNGGGEISFNDIQRPLTDEEKKLIQESNSSLINIGLDMNYSDKGKAEITGNPDDNGKFKIPNLRNVMLTAPYMHDGRFKTIDEVLDFYSKGITSHPNLDSRLITDNAKPQVLSISDQERVYLKSFLNSLTDHSFISDQKFSDPFVNN